ncbi:MAG: hydrogenase formation protein HypD, partial [Deltaproteobacteria bacterium]|nr:hydrogenase formation protein HypD [Deltaproteobacteria bacterium]
EIRDEFSGFDAEKRFAMGQLECGGEELKGCACAMVIKGLETPQECPLFAGVCTPDSPRGPCMVSSEGTCAAYFQYER